MCLACSPLRHPTLSARTAVRHLTNSGPVSTRAPPTSLVTTRKGRQVNTIILCLRTRHRRPRPSISHHLKANASLTVAMSLGACCVPGTGRIRNAPNLVSLGVCHSALTSGLGGSSRLGTRAPQTACVSVCMQACVCMCACKRGDVRDRMRQEKRDRHSDQRDEHSNRVKP